MTAPDPDELLTQPEVAALVGRPIGTVRGWACTGHLVAVKRHAGRPYYRRADALQVAAEVEARGGRRKCEESSDTETMEELDALIAERMRCLPDWWPAPGELDHEGDNVKLPGANRRGAA